MKRLCTPYKMARELRNTPSGTPHHSTLVRDAADLIERQAEEIAELKSDYLRRHNDACDRLEENLRLTAERAELIEALRPMAVDMDDPNWDDMGLAELELTIGDCRRARALLERIEAGVVSGSVPTTAGNHRDGKTAEMNESKRRW